MVELRIKSPLLAERLIQAENRRGGWGTLSVEFRVKTHRI